MRRTDWEVVGILGFTVVFLLFCLTGLWIATHRDTYPTPTGDCPPQHVYIDGDEHEGDGCVPEELLEELRKEEV